ncbi:MAG: SpoIIIAC/SpoIIIAD family protein [Oscillospiraceae bacterium]
MINILSVCGLVFCIVILSKVLEKTSKEYVILISIVSCLMILSYLLLQLTPILDLIYQLTNILNDGEDIYILLLKSLGICIVTNLAVDVCKDSGETALSSVVLMCGKVCMLILSIPLLNELISIIRQVIFN